MIVNSDTLAAIRTDFEALFLESYAGYQAVWQQAATEFPTNSEFLDLSWLGAPPAMKQWVDEKTVEGLRRSRYVIANLEWEATLGVKRSAIEVDNLGIYKPRIQEMGIEGKRHPDELVSRLLSNGGVGLAFDGVTFFNNARTIGNSGNIDNNLAGTGVTQAQFAADFIAARLALSSFLNDQAKPANVAPQLVAWIPPLLQNAAELTFNASMIAATDNVLKGAAGIVVDPYLTQFDVNDWYLLNVAGPIKPLALSMRKRPAMQALDSPTSDHVFKYGEFLYSVEASYAGGYLLPWKAIRTVN